LQTKKQSNEINAWLFVDKPIGYSSNQILTIIKKELHPTKIGHGGTLDPLAEGVLPICFGEATKTVDYVLNANKSYIFTIKFGLKTASDDMEGEILETNDFMPPIDAIETILPKFLGEITQIPSKFSAIKINGKRSYDLARAGIDFEMKSRQIKIFELTLLDYNVQEKIAKFYCKVSKGTYIRTLAVDIAKAVNAIGVVCYLRREAIELNKEFILISLNNVYNIKKYLDDKKVFLSIEDMLDDISAYPLTIHQVLELFNGNTKNLVYVDKNHNIVKATYENKVIALLKSNGEGALEILRVFNTYKKLLTN
jgi:tRNA pseudouridine55 synthase